MNQQQFYDKMINRLDKMCASLDKIVRTLEAIKKSEMNKYSDQLNEMDLDIE